MDIALMSMALSQGQINQQASISVISKAMDRAQVNADFINKMIGDASGKALQHAAQPHLGGSMDVSV